MTKKSKTKRIKAEKYQTEEQVEIIRFIKILVILIVIVLGVYLFTRAFVTKDLLNNKDKENDTPITGQINYDKTIIGTMLNKTEDEYYVMMYDAEDLNSVYYSGLISTYKKNEDALKVYYADLGNELNQKYIIEENDVINVTNLENFKVKELALIKVKKGKIVKSLIKEEDIAKELEYIKNTEE